VSLDKLHYMPADFKLDSAHLNGTFDHALFVALARYQNDHKITAHGYYACVTTRDSIKDVLAGGSGIVDAVPVAQASQPKPQGWFGRLFENKTMLRQQTVVNLVVRKCHYYFGERHSDRDTESYLTAVGSHLEYPTDERAGTVAIDPEHCEFGSLVQVIENGKVLSFVADDRGSAVILKKASHGRTLVFDFCSKEQLGSDYGSIRVFHYAGVPIQQLTAEQKENLHKLKYWHNGQFVPPVSVVQNYQGMKVAQR
jgi:3D (Asp-Asp-Asp) domain-containing protein